MPPPNGPGPWGKAFRAPLEFASGALLQVPAHVLRGGRNLASLLGMVPGEGPMDRLSMKFGDMLGDYEEWERRVGPQGLAGDLGAMAGELGMTAAEIIYTGGAIRSAASLGKLGKGGQWLGKRSGTFLGEAAKDALAVAPIDAVYAINPETSVTSVASQLLPQGSAGQRAAEKLNRSFAGRLAGEMGLGITADVGFRTIGSSLKGGYKLARGERPDTFLASGYHPGEEVVPPAFDLDEMISGLVGPDTPSKADWSEAISVALRDNASTMPTVDRSRLTEALTAVKQGGSMDSFEPILTKYGVNEALDRATKAAEMVTKAVVSEQAEEAAVADPFLTASHLSTAARVTAGGVGLAGMALGNENQQRFGGAGLAAVGLLGIPRLGRAAWKSDLGPLSLQSRMGQSLSGHMLKQGEGAPKFAMRASGGDGSWHHIIHQRGVGVSRTEDEWSGLSKWLESQGDAQLTLDDINKYMGQHGVQLREIVNESRGDRYAGAEGSKHRQSVTSGSMGTKMRYSGAKMEELSRLGSDQRKVLADYIQENYGKAREVVGWDEFEEMRIDEGVYRADDFQPENMGHLGQYDPDSAMGSRDYFDHAPSETLLDDARLIAQHLDGDADRALMDVIEEEMIGPYRTDAGVRGSQPSALIADDLQFNRINADADSEIMYGLNFEGGSPTRWAQNEDWEDMSIEGGDMYREIAIVIEAKPRPATSNVPSDASKSVDDAELTGMDLEGDALYGRIRADEAVGGAKPVAEVTEPYGGTVTGAADDPSANLPFQIDNHWEDPATGQKLKNVLLHIRYQIRTVKDGRRMLFVDEMQSSLHQKARKYGYRDELQADGTLRKFDDILEDMDIEREEYLLEMAESEKLMAHWRQTLDEIVPDEGTTRWQEAYDKDVSGLPYHGEEHVRGGLASLELRAEKMKAYIDVIENTGGVYDEVTRRRTAAGMMRGNDFWRTGEKDLPLGDGNNGLNFIKNAFHMKEIVEDDALVRAYQNVLRVGDAIEKKKQAVPWAPFGGVRGAPAGHKSINASDWSKLGWRRLLAEAALEKVDAIGWLPGLHQAARSGNAAANRMKGLVVRRIGSKSELALDGRYNARYDLYVTNLDGTRRSAGQGISREKAIEHGVTPAMLDEVDAAEVMYSTPQGMNAKTGKTVNFGVDRLTLTPQGGGRGFYDKTVKGNLVKVAREFFPELDKKSLTASIKRDVEDLSFESAPQADVPEVYHPDYPKQVKPRMPVDEAGWTGDADNLRYSIIDDWVDTPLNEPTTHGGAPSSGLAYVNEVGQPTAIMDHPDRLFEVAHPDTGEVVQFSGLDFIEARVAQGVNTEPSALSSKDRITQLLMPGGDFAEAGVALSTTGEPLMLFGAGGGEYMSQTMTVVRRNLGDAGEPTVWEFYSHPTKKQPYGVDDLTTGEVFKEPPRLIARFVPRQTAGSNMIGKWEGNESNVQATLDFLEAHRSKLVAAHETKTRGILSEEDFRIKDFVWSMDVPKITTTTETGAEVVTSLLDKVLGPEATSPRLLSGNWIGGGLLGGVGGSLIEADTPEDRGVNIMGGFAAGAGLVGLGPKMARMVASQSKTGRKVLGKAQNAHDNAVAARAKSPTMGATDQEALEQLGPDSAVAKAAKQMAPTGKPKPKIPEEDRLLTPLERIRQGVTRDVLSLEKLDDVAGKDKRVAIAAGQARGFVMMAEPFLQEVLGPIVKEHADHLDLAAYLAHAERRIEIHGIYGDDKVTTEQLFHANEVIAELANHPEIAKIEAAKDGLQDFYAQLLEMKHKSGILSDAQYDAITASGMKYVPFLPEDLVVRDDSPFTTIADIYQFQSGTGVRSMSDNVNDAILVNPWEQAIRDTYETFRRVQKQNLTNVITQLIDEEPALLGKYVSVLGGSKPKGEPQIGMYVSALRDGKKVWYHVKDPDLVASWSSVNKKIQEIGFTRLANNMRNFMQSGVTLNPVFAMRNGIRDFFMSAVQTRLNEGVPVLGWIPPELQVAGAGAIGYATAEEGSELKNVAAGAALLGTTHLAAHSLRVSSALMDILGPHNIGMAAGGLAGYWSASDDDSIGEIMGRTATGAMLGRTAGAVAGLAGLRGRAGSLDDFYKAGGGQFGLYSATKEDATRMLDDLIKSGVAPGDIIRPEGFGDAIRLIFQPINALLNMPKTPKGIWQAATGAVNRFGRAIETAPRLAEFNRLRGAGVDTAEAAVRARDLSLDFSVHGTYKTTQFFTKSTPFLNPMLQGADKLVRMTGESDVWAAAAATIIAPSVLLWQMNHSDPDVASEYAARPDWERNSYWLLSKKILNKFGMTAESEGFYRVPKPFELGFVYGSLPEQALDVVNEYNSTGLNLSIADWAGEAGDTFLDFAGSFMSPSLPLPFGPMLQGHAGEHGYSLFTGRPINPLPWMNIRPEDQATPYTSTLAMTAARVPVLQDILALAGLKTPAMIDFAIQGYGGTVAKELNHVVTQASRYYGWDTRPEPPTQRRYAARDFQTNDTLVTQHESDFRDSFSSHESSWNSLQMAIQNDPTKVSQLMGDEDFVNEIAKYQLGRDFKKYVDGLTKARREIRFVGALDEDTKRNVTLELTVAIAGIAEQHKRALRLLEQRQKEMMSAKRGRRLAG